MHRFKKGDRLVWSRLEATNDLGLEDCPVTVLDSAVSTSWRPIYEVQLMDRPDTSPYWVPETELEPLDRVRSSYTSPPLSAQQVQALMAQLEVVDRKGLGVCLRITETRDGTIVQVLPPEVEDR